MEPLLPILKGSLVCLEPLGMKHLEDLTVSGQEERIWKYLSRKLLSQEAVKQWIEDNLEDVKKGIRYPFAIIHKDSQKAIGSTSYLSVSQEHRGIEIGWTWLSPLYWKSGINKECKLLLLQHAFETLGCIRVQLKTDQRNILSREAIESLGAHFEGILRNHMILPDGTYRDSVFYSIIASEWPMVKKNLLEKLGKGTPPSAKKVEQ